MRRDTDIVHEQLDIGIGSLPPCIEADFKRLQQRNLHPADKANLLRLGFERGDDTGEERAFLRAIGERGHVRLLNYLVNQREFDVRKLTCHPLNRFAEPKPNADDDVIPEFGEPTECQFGVGTLTGVHLCQLQVECVRRFFRPGVGGIVKREIAAPADIVN